MKYYLRVMVKMLMLCCIIAAGGCDQSSSNDGSSLLSLLMNNFSDNASTGSSTNPNGADPALPEWKPFTKGKDMPKRMLLDGNKIEMSTEVIEESELAGMNATMADIWQLVMNTFNLFN